MKRIIYIITILTSISLGAQDKTWTLQECIDYAVENSISVRQSQNTVSQKEIDLNTAQNRHLPSFAAQASENFSFGRGLTANNTYDNANTTSTSFQLGGELPIFTGLDVTNNIKISKLNLEAALKDLDKAKEDISVSVAQSFVEILYNKELLEVATAQVSQDERLLESIKAKHEVGRLDESQVAAQAATLAQSRLQKTQAENNYRLSLLSLSQLMELQSPEGFQIASPDVAVFEPGLLMNPEEIYAQAVSSKPAVLSAQSSLESAKIAIERAKGAYLPTLSLNGGIGTNYYTTSKMQAASFGDQMKNNFSQYIGLSLNIPIFSRFNTRNQVKQAKLSYDNQNLQLESVKKTLYKEIQQAYYNAVAAQAKLSSSSETATSSLRLYELTEEKYQNGKASITDYNDAKNNNLKAQSEYLKAKYECLFQTKLLDFYRGVKW